MVDIVVVDVERFSDSCGYSVAHLEYVGNRDVLDLHQHKKPAAYYEHGAAVRRNGSSIDGLPALC